jgi:hypothetical protein
MAAGLHENKSHTHCAQGFTNEHFVTIYIVEDGDRFEMDDRVSARLDMIEPADSL